MDREALADHPRATQLRHNRPEPGTFLTETDRTVRPTTPHACPSAREGPACGQQANEMQSPSQTGCADRSRFCGPASQALARVRADCPPPNGPLGNAAILRPNEARNWLPGAKRQPEGAEGFITPESAIYGPASLRVDHIA
jgi:hypothetical protein